MLKNKISTFSILIIFLVMSIAGIAVLPLLPVKLNPNETNPKLNISYNLSNSSPRIVEMNVTSKLEAALSRIKGIKNISSKSGNGYGYINIEFDKYVNIDIVRFEASAIIRQLKSELPENMSYPHISYQSKDDIKNKPFISYTINAPEIPYKIQNYAEEVIRMRMSHLSDIYKIDINGATPMEWHIEYDIKKLNSLGISIEDVKKSIQLYNIKDYLGTGNICLSDNKDSQWIRLLITCNESDINRYNFDPSQIFLKDRSGALIRLSQLVNIKYVEEKPQSYFRINGLNSIYVSFISNENANQLELGKQIRENMLLIQTEMPENYEMHLSYDSTKYITSELNKIYFRSITTILILLLFVLLVSRSFRYLILILLSLVTNICIAFIFYYFSGIEIQLYSLAGITISLSLIIDNTIVMADYYKNNKNRRVFLAILAATLTTICALIGVFFLDENIRLILRDFALVVIINLTVSLIIALFFVPELFNRLHNNLSVNRTERISRKKLLLWFNRFYYKQIRFMMNRRKLMFIILILLFGFPVFLIPEKYEAASDGKLTMYQEKYNKFVKQQFNKEYLIPAFKTMFGGTLRLFSEKVYSGRYGKTNTEPVLYISSVMPNGTTIEQINHIMTQMESFLGTFDGIRQFQTNVYNSRQACVNVFFTEESKKKGFPFYLKEEVIQQSLQIGGGAWYIYGLEDQGFFNIVREQTGNYGIDVYGYNYDELYKYAEQMRDSLMKYERINDVVINYQPSEWKEDYEEFVFSFDKHRMINSNITIDNLYNNLNPIFGNNIYLGDILSNGKNEKLSLVSINASDTWNMINDHNYLNGNTFKLSEFAHVEKRNISQIISRDNQQYRLCLQYNYIGSARRGDKIHENIIETFNKVMPLGYYSKSLSNDNFRNNSLDYYFLILLVIIAIFFSTSILFNSIKQPLAIIFIIPVSFISIFLSFYIFNVSFDYGGFAAFILLCGITGNSSIYLLDEFNNISSRHPFMSPINRYIKAWNHKFMPIFLTIISTILGFSPFIMELEKEAFWYPLTIGTIGGLVMSFIGIFFYLPLFIIENKKLYK